MRIMDIVVTNEKQEYVGVLLGNGNGSFLTEMIFLSRFGSDSAIFSYLNNDDYLDMIMISFERNIVDIRLGYGHGSFTKSTIYSVSCQPKHVTVWVTSTTVNKSIVFLRVQSCIQVALILKDEQ